MRSGRPDPITTDVIPTPMAAGLDLEPFAKRRTSRGMSIRSWRRSWRATNTSRALPWKMRRNSLPHQLDDGIEVELGRQGLADLVDDSQLGVALAGLVEGPGALERRRDVLGDEGQHLEIALGVAAVRAVALDGDHAERPALGSERDTEPRDRQRPQEGDLALIDELPPALLGEEQRDARPEHVARDPTRIVLPELIPDRGIRQFRVDCVEVDGKLIQFVASS